MGVPDSPRPRLEMHDARPHIARRRLLDDRILPDRSGEVISRRTARRRRSRCFYVHRHFPCRQPSECPVETNIAQNQDRSAAPVAAVRSPLRRLKIVAVLWHCLILGAWSGCFRMRTMVSAKGGRRVRRVVMIVASLLLGLSLAACSKCDVPTWHRDSPTAP